jgi:hypothetical protein
MALCIRAVRANNNPVNSPALGLHQAAEFAVHRAQGVTIKQASREPRLVAGHSDGVPGLAQVGNCPDTAGKWPPLVDIFHELPGIAINHPISVEDD